MVMCAPVRSLTHFLDIFLATVSYPLDLLLIFLVFQRKVLHKLTFLVVYAVVYVPRNIVMGWLSHTALYGTRGVFFLYWGLAFLLSFLRLLLIGEICRRVLRAYAAVWYFAWRFLVIVAGIFLVWTASAVVQNAGHWKWLITAADQRVSVMQAVILLLVLGIGTYYQVHISRFFQLIFVGSCIYSALQVTNNALIRIMPIPPDSLFDYIQRSDITIMVAIWVWALWRWADVPSISPEMISQEVYDNVSPDVHSRLQILNDRLAKMLKKDK